jgi:putative hemolysin
MTTSLGVTVLIILLVFSAFFSASEVAFLSLRRAAVLRIQRRKQFGAQQVAHFAEHPERRLLPTILLGNNLVNTAFASISTAIVLTFVSERWGIVIATAAATVVVLVIGEVLPKSIGVRKSETVARVAAYPLSWIERLLLPGVVLLRNFTHLAMRFIGGRDDRGPVTEEDLRIMISAGRDAGTVVHREAQLAENVFRFGDKKVWDVMTPRTEVPWVRSGATAREFLELYHAEPHGRYPIYDTSVDNVVGVLAARDTLMAIASGEIKLHDDVTMLRRPAFFTPDSKPLPALLDEMRAAGAQIAIAVDEFGGVAGTVTISQVLEPLVGPLTREGLEESGGVVSLDAETFEVNGDLPIEAVNERVNASLPIGDYVTVAGLVLDNLGHIPEEGERLQVGDMLIRVSRMDGRRIARVQIRKATPREQPTADASVD